MKSWIVGTTNGNVVMNVSGTFGLVMVHVRNGIGNVPMTLGMTM